MTFYEMVYNIEHIFEIKTGEIAITIYYILLLICFLLFSCYIYYSVWKRNSETYNTVLDCNYLPGSIVSLITIYSYSLLLLFFFRKFFLINIFEIQEYILIILISSIWLFNNDIKETSSHNINYLVFKFYIIFINVLSGLFFCAEDNMIIFIWAILQYIFLSKVTELKTIYTEIFLINSLVCSVYSIFLAEMGIIKNIYFVSFYMIYCLGINKMKELLSKKDIFKIVSTERNIKNYILAQLNFIQLFECFVFFYLNKYRITFVFHICYSVIYIFILIVRKFNLFLFLFCMLLFNNNMNTRRTQLYLIENSSAILLRAQNNLPKVQVRFMQSAMKLAGAVLAKENLTIANAGAAAGVVSAITGVVALVKDNEVMREVIETKDEVIKAKDETIKALQAQLADRQKEKSNCIIS